MAPLTSFPTPLLRNRGTRDFVTGKRTLRKGRPLRRATHAPLGNSGFYLGCNGGKRQRKNTAKPVIIQYIYIHSHNALYSTQTRSDTRLCLCYVSLRIRRNSRGDDARVVFIALFPLTLGSKHTSPRKNRSQWPTARSRRDVARKPISSATGNAVAITPPLLGSWCLSLRAFYLLRQVLR